MAYGGPGGRHSGLVGILESGGMAPVTNTQLEVAWWGTRYKFSKTWRNHSHNKALNDLQMSNYAQLLVAVFTHLYNVRQDKGTYHGK